MIIECPNCNKKFNLNEKLIPDDGRSLKCSVCQHVWYFKIIENKVNNEQKLSKNKITISDINVLEINKKNNNLKEEKTDEKRQIASKEYVSEKKIKEKINDKNTIKLKMTFIYIFILIISLLGLIFLLDTFKYNLSNVFPGIIPLFDSLYETLLDLKLFIKDLAS